MVTKKLIRNLRKFIGGILTIALITLSSCNSKVYTSGTYGNMKPYIVKPEYRGENTSATYISGDLSIGAHQQPPEDEDTKLIAAVRANKSFTRKNFNYHYGGGFTYGNYKFGSEEFPNVSSGDKASFYGVNAIIGANINLPTEKMDWRILGADVAYHYEWGPYQDRLDEIKNAGNAFVFNQQHILSATIGSEAIFKRKNGDNIGLGFYVGDLINKQGDLKGEDATFFGITLNYTFKRFTISYVHENGGDQISSSKFGLHYKLF